MTTQKHIIHKLVVDVETASEQSAKEFSAEIDTFIQNRIFPELELMLDKLAPKTELFRFNRLVINLKPENLNDTALVVSKIRQQLLEQISGITTQKDLFTESINTETDDVGTKIITASENYETIFFQFLKTGSLPWYADNTQIRKFLRISNWKKVLEKQQFTEQLRFLLSSSNLFVQRFVKQIPLKNILYFIAKQDLVREEKIMELHKELVKTTHDFQHKFLHTALSFVFAESDSRNLNPALTSRVFELEMRMMAKEGTLLFTEWQRYFTPLAFRKFTEATNQPNTASTEFDEKHQEHPVENENILEDFPTIISTEEKQEREEEPLQEIATSGDLFVQNAGLVLFHPFLPALFKSFSWLDNQGKLMEENREPAVQLLHYCATGKDQYFEADLLLEKLLCGMPFKQTLSLSSLLSAQMKREGTKMVKALLKNWPQLKATSPAGLRDGFIQRSGKLSKIDTGLKLLVERKTIDILLQYLPWNIAVIKLPWQQEILFVEW